MISVHQTSTNDRSADHAYLDVLAAIIDAVSRYAVETDPDAVQEFRTTLEQAQTRLKAAPNEPHQTTPTQITSDIRGTLRKYRDHAAVYIERLRLDVKTATEALDSFLSTVEGGGSATEGMLTEEIQHLRSLLTCDSLEELRTGVEQSTRTLAEYAEKVRQENDSVISQLKSEIQILHRNLDEAQRAAKLDPLTGMARRDEFVRLLRRRIVAGESVGVITIWLQNLRELACEYPAAIEEIRGAFSGRMHNVIPGTAAAGEWDQSSFCILCTQDSMPSMSARLERISSGRYVYMREGAAETFDVTAVVSCIRHENGEDADSFLGRLRSALLAVQGIA